MSAELQSFNLDHQASALLSSGVASDRVLSIVGARDADAYGLRVARQLGALAAQSGVCVLSGGARGVDMAAHEGALSQGGVSLAVLGCGLSRAPRRLRPLQAQGLGLVSPYDAEAPGHPWRFAKRNEHIAEASGALIVVQALETSGSLISARHALSLGRSVWVCPGPIGGPHAGCYALLKEGASLLPTLQAWLSSFGEEGGAHSARVATRTPSHELESTARAERAPDSALYQAAGPRPSTIGELAERAQMSLPSALSEATLLELSGWLMVTPTGAFVRVEGRP